MAHPQGGWDFDKYKDIMIGYGTPPNHLSCNNCLAVGRSLGSHFITFNRNSLSSSIRQSSSISLICLCFLLSLMYWVAEASTDHLSHCLNWTWFSSTWAPHWSLAHGFRVHLLVWKIIRGRYCAKFGCLLRSETVEKLERIKSLNQSVFSVSSAFKAAT